MNHRQKSEFVKPPADGDFAKWAKNMKALSAARDGVLSTPSTAPFEGVGRHLTLQPNFKGVKSTSDLGKVIKGLRKKRKLSQQAFADLAGVGRRFLSELENGKETLEIGKVLQVVSAAGVDLLAKER